VAKQREGGCGENMVQERLKEFTENQFLCTIMLGPVVENSIIGTFPCSNFHVVILENYDNLHTLKVKIKK